ncbi:MAG TPA: hypothetical protein VGD14_02875 [bacterium]
MSSLAWWTGKTGGGISATADKTSSAHRLIVGRKERGHTKGGRTHSPRNGHEMLILPVQMVQTRWCMALPALYHSKSRTDW